MKAMEKEFNIITASEARTAVEGDATEMLKKLDANIRYAVKKGENRIRVPYDMTRTDGYEVSFKNTAVLSALQNAGYIVSHKSEDRQFTDVWIEVSW